MNSSDAVNSELPSCFHRQGTSAELGQRGLESVNLDRLLDEVPIATTGSRGAEYSAVIWWTGGEYSPPIRRPGDDAHYVESGTDRTCSGLRQAVGDRDE